MTEYEKGWNDALTEGAAVIRDMACKHRCEHMGCKGIRIAAGRLDERKHSRPAPSPMSRAWDADGREVAE